MDKGVLQQYNPPLYTYAKPNNLFVADFVGNPTMNFIEAKLINVIDSRQVEVELLGTKAVFESNEDLGEIPQDLIIGIRPEYVRCGKKGIDGVIYSSLPGGMETTIKVDVEGTIVTSVEFGIIDYPVDTKTKITFTSDNIVLFSKETTNRLANGSLKL